MSFQVLTPFINPISSSLKEGSLWGVKLGSIYIHTSVEIFKGKLEATSETNYKLKSSNIVWRVMNHDHYAFYPGFTSFLFLVAPKNIGVSEMLNTFMAT